MPSRRNEEQKGQSIIIVAFIFLGLIIMAAIAVDVTSAYSQRRTAQNAADAAAIAAAQELGHYLRGESVTNADVLYQLEDFAQRNGAAGVTGQYLDENRAPLAEIVDDGYDPPPGALGVEATAFITAPAFFGGAVGMDGYPLSAEAAVEFATVCYGGDCLLPISVHLAGFDSEPDDDTLINFEEGVCYNLWDGLGGANFGWLNWSNQGHQYSCKTHVDLDAPDDCSADCLDINMNPEYCQDQPDDMVSVGDYVGGAPGVKNADMLRGWLDHYIDNNIIARFIVYENTSDFGGPACGKTLWQDGVIHKQQGTYYEVAGFAAFQITGYRLSKGGGPPVHRDCDWDNDGEVDPDEEWCQPQNCVDYPNNDGLCCLEWVEEEPAGSNVFICIDWGECEYVTGDVNRITGIFHPWTEETYDTCEAIGNVWAPHLFK